MFLCIIGSIGVQLSWDVAISAATNNSLPMSDSPILIEWSLRAVNCPTCPIATPFTTILELHEVSQHAGIKAFYCENSLLS